MKVFENIFVLHLIFLSRRPELRVSKKGARMWLGSFLMPTALFMALLENISLRVCWLVPTIFPHNLTIPFNLFFSLSHKEPNQQIIEKARMD